eukprot:SAG31_NODE_1567_length_7859_cov_18.238531_4_plen_55_part_00
MRFRCWNGTYLGDKDSEDGYLSGVEAASTVVCCDMHATAHPQWSPHHMHPAGTI